MTDKIQTLHCTFANKESLYLAYMPFIKNKALFIRTPHLYSLGEMVLLELTLLNDPEPYLVEGKVVWITPKGAQENKPCGMGIQFIGENSRYLIHKIETYLAEMLESTLFTDTV